MLTHFLTYHLTYPSNTLTYPSNTPTTQSDNIFSLHPCILYPCRPPYSVHVSFIEIYNDECKDLLHPDIASRDIFIREDKEGHIFMTGAREEEVHDASEALVYLGRGPPF